MEPLTSHISTSDRGLSLCSRWAISRISPPYFRFSRSVFRRSSQLPSPGVILRVRLRPKSHDNSVIIRFASAISDGLKLEKSFCRRTSLTL